MATSLVSAYRRLTDSAIPLPVLIYLLTVTIPIGFNLGPLAMTSLRLFLLVMVLPLLGRLLAGRYGKILPTDILFLMHITWASLALAINNPDQVIQQIGSVGVEFIGGYLVGRAYIRTPEAFAALCRWLVIFVLCSTPFALYEAKTGNPIIVEMIRKIPGVVSVGVVTIEGRMGLERVQAMFAHPIHYGLFCSVAFSLCLVGLKDIMPTKRRLISSAIVALSGFLALSSGALLAIILQMALIAWYTILRRVEGRWWILVGLFVLAYIVIDLFSNRTPLKVFMSYATFSAHNAYWRGIIFDWGIKNVFGSVEDNIPASLLVGIGLRDWVRPDYMHSGSMDNFWLVMAVRYGVPGFLLLAIGYSIAVIKAMRRDFRGDPVLTQFRRAWVFTFLGLSFTLSTVHVWTNIYSFVFFVFGAGMWLLTAQVAATTTPDLPGGARPAPAGRAVARGRQPEAANDGAAPHARAPSQHTRFPQLRQRRDAPPD